MISLRELWVLLKQSVNGWLDDRAPSMGAALAFYTALSIAPLLIIAIGVAGLVFGRDAAQAAIVFQLQGLLGEAGGVAIEEMLKANADFGSSALKMVIGVAGLLVTATTAFVELQDDLDRIWKAEPRVGSGVLNLLRSRLLSFGMVLSVGFLLTVSLLASAGVAALGNSLLSEMEFLLHAITLLTSLVVTTVLFALIYKVLPNVSIAWKDVWIGAVITAVLFEVGKVLIGLYIGKTSAASSFGAAGPFVVLMLWIYYSTQIVLLGAEFTYAYAHRRDGQPKVAAAPAKVADSGANVGGAGSAPSVSLKSTITSAVEPEPSLNGERLVVQSLAASAAGLVAGWMMGRLAHKLTAKVRTAT